MSRTHGEIDGELCGVPVEVSEGKAVVRLEVTKRMGVDERGLAHGGFVFGAADYAAMLAVNDPNVVLGEATTRFTAPTRVGDTLTATAAVSEEKGKKRIVTVTVGTSDSVTVMEGTFTAFVLPKHVLDK